MDRETKTIKTPLDSNVVIIKTWLTAREKRTISAIFTSKAKFNTEKNDFNVDASILNDLQDEQIKNIVISVDGKSENILDTCLDLKAKDYDYILSEIEKVVNPEIDKKK